MNNDELSLTMPSDEVLKLSNQESSSYIFPTLRDTFAMAAVSGILANQNTQQNTPHYVADEAYNIADAMFERRKK